MKLFLSLQQSDASSPGKMKLKYTIIKTDEQYYEYCNILEKLVFSNNHSFKDEIELLTFLIEKWDDELQLNDDLDPVELLKHLMKEHDLRARDLANILELTKGTISKILNYQKGFSKETIRKLSDYFKLRQDAVNRPYSLIGKAS